MLDDDRCAAPPIQAVPPIAAPPTVSPAAVPSVAWSKETINTIRGAQTFVLVILFLLFALAAVGHLDQRYYHADKFNNDNAVEATANALEGIRRNLPMDAPTWFIAALYCWLILTVNRLRWAIQDRG